MRLIVLEPSRGQISITQRDMVVDLVRGCDERGVDLIFEDCTLRQLIDQARNRLIYRLSTYDDEDWGLWLDSDVDAKADLIFELMHRPEEVIARAYPLKSGENAPADEVGWSAEVIVNSQGEGLWSEDKRLLQCTFTGFGFVLMRVTAAKKTVKKYGLRGQGVPRDAGTCIPVFDLVDNEYGIRCYEDVSFCHRWVKEMCEPLWLAPDGWVRNGDRSGVFLESLQKTMQMPEGLGAE